MSEAVALLGDWEALNNGDLNNAMRFFLLFKLKFVYSTSVFISGDFCKVGPHEPGSFKRHGSIFPLLEAWPRPPGDFRGGPILVARSFRWPQACPGWWQHLLEPCLLLHLEFSLGVQTSSFS